MSAPPPVVPVGARERLLRAAAAQHALTAPGEGRSAAAIRFGVCLHHSWLEEPAGTPDLGQDQQKALATILALGDLIHARPVLVDAGPGIGLHALGLKAIRPELEIVAFEPSPAAWGLLQRTIRDAGLTGFRLERLALAADAGVVAPPDLPELGTPPAEARLPTLALVPRQRLDDVRDLPPVSILRIPAEAQPLGVLAGASATIARCRPVILVHWPAGRDGARLLEAAALLEYLSFTVDLVPIRGATLPGSPGRAQDVLLLPAALMPRIAAASGVRGQAAVTAAPAEGPRRSIDPAPGERAPRISICIPTYNRAPLLAQAIASALAQDYSHLEVLIGDNGSTDATEALCRRHAADPRVRYYRSARNEGAAANIRALVRHHASGDYVLVLSDDDVLSDPAYLSKAAALLRAHRDDQLMLVFSNAVVWSEARQAVVSVNDFRVPEFLPGPELFERWWASFGGDTVFVPFLTAIFHRQTAADLFFADEDVMAGDTMLWWKLLLAGNAGFVDTRAAVYRVHGGNDSNTASLLRHIPNLRMFVEPARLAVEAGYDLSWIRAWKHRMASAFIMTIAPPGVRQAFLDSDVQTDLMALYRRAHQEGLPAEAERVEEDRILEQARAFLTARALAASGDGRRASA